LRSPPPLFSSAPALTDPGMSSLPPITSRRYAGHEAVPRGNFWPRHPGLQVLHRRWWVVCVCLCVGGTERRGGLEPAPAPPWLAAAAGAGGGRCPAASSPASCASVFPHTGWCGWGQALRVMRMPEALLRSIHQLPAAARPPPPQRLYRWPTTRNTAWLPTSGRGWVDARAGPWGLGFTFARGVRGITQPAAPLPCQLAGCGLSQAPGQLLLLFLPRGLARLAKTLCPPLPSHPIAQRPHSPPPHSPALRCRTWAARGGWPSGWSTAWWG
jgi:hypothetical protein